MQLTLYSDISLRMLMYLARHKESSVTIRDAASALNVQYTHLVKVVHQLGREGLLDTRRGTGGGVRLRSVPRHSDLAREIGATRETVTRMLTRLEQDGYIRRFGRQIIVPDPDRLA